MRKHQVIVASAVVLYLAALGVSWYVGTRNAYGKTLKLIERSERDFVNTIENSADSVLLHCCAELLSEMRGKALSATGDQLRSYQHRFLVDEINVIGSNGVIVASSIPKLEGHDFAEHPETAEFLCLLRDVKLYSQPFRPGTINPEDVCKYYGVALPSRRGFLQVGMNIERLAGSLSCLDQNELRDWPFGRMGYFDFYDADGDGVCDYDAGNPPDGTIRRVVRDGRAVYVRPFSYCGYRYVAVLPEREYFGERNVNFQIFAPTLAVVIVFLAYFMISMTRASDRERKHRESEDAVRKRDLGMAKAIQLSVLPSVERYRKVVFSASFAAEMRPAKEVGGDLFDYYFIDSTHLAIIVADVAGKGISAAMFMMRVKNELYNALCSEHELLTAVSVANARICENNDAEMFVTAWLGLLDIHSGEIEYVNAGHNRPFVRRADGSVEKLTERGGLILGMFPTAKYKASHLALDPGDFLYLFTDGVTEAMDRKQKTYGEERLCEVLRRCPSRPEDILAEVDRSVKEYVGSAEQSDDITSLALVWHGVPEVHMRTFAGEEASLGPAMDWLSGEIGLVGKLARSRLLNAADEMMTNIVSYSGTKTYAITVENSQARTRVTFVDHGPEYNPLSHVDPDTRLPLEDRPIGGLGILMTKRLVDAVHYHRERDRNILTLVKLDDL